MTGLPRHLLAEAVGTLLLLATIVGSGIMGEALANGQAGAAQLSELHNAGSNFLCHPNGQKAFRSNCLIMTLPARHIDRGNAENGCQQTNRHNWCNMFTQKYHTQKHADPCPQIGLARNAQ